jgi:hypothetical protein
MADLTARKPESVRPTGRPRAREGPPSHRIGERILHSVRNTGCPRRDGSQGARVARPKGAFRPASLRASRHCGLWTALGLGTPSGRGLLLWMEHLVRTVGAVHPSWGMGLAAVAPTVMLVLEVRTGLLRGRPTGTSGRARRAIVGWGLVAAALPASFPVLGPGAVLAGLAILGFLAGATSTLLCILPVYLPTLRSEPARSGPGL